MNDPVRENDLMMTRRQLFGRGVLGLGTSALAGLFRGNDAIAATTSPIAATSSGHMDGLHHRAKAKHVIYLFMSGGPSHHDMWDYKPELSKKFGEQLPDHCLLYTSPSPRD